MNSSVEKPPMPTMPWETLRLFLWIVATDHRDFVEWQPPIDREKGIIYEPYLIPARHLCAEAAPYIDQIHVWKKEIFERDQIIARANQTIRDLQKANEYLSELIGDKDDELP